MKKLDISRHYAVLDEIQTKKLNRLHWDGLHPNAQRSHTKFELELLQNTVQGYIKLIKPKYYSIELQAYIKTLKEIEKNSKEVDEFLNNVHEKQKEMHLVIDKIHEITKEKGKSYSYESYKEFYYLGKIVELEKRINKLENVKKIKSTS